MQLRIQKDFITISNLKVYSQQSENDKIQNRINSNNNR